MLTERSQWFNTLNSVRPRGVPYKNIGKRDVYINHGIWQGVLDYDAPQQLVDPIPEVYTHDNRIVPSGSYFPFCGMNVMWRREAIPLSYHLLMGQMRDFRSPSVPSLSDRPLIKLPFDRFGDIWSGIIQKKVCDRLGWAISTGTPYIHHDRASNPFVNLRKEANGIEVNESFWEIVDRTSFSQDVVDPHEDNVYSLYYDIAEEIRLIKGEHERYWRDLSIAMKVWANLFTT
jgi:reversibly glycosylated polypeptide/UDP-arabinopyranose mutase